MLNSSRPSVACLALLLLLSILLGGALPGHAAPPDRLFKKGIQLLNRGEFERSARVLRQAAARARDPDLGAKIRLYLGRALVIVGRRLQARAAFAEALKQDPGVVPDAEVVRPGTVALFHSVRKGLRGKLAVTSRIIGARVLVDGEHVGETPLRLEVGVGRHLVEVRGKRPGQRYREDVVVPFQQVMSVRASLPRVDAPAPVTSTPPKPAIPAAVVVPLSGPTPAPRPALDRGTPLYKKWWFWTIVGAVAVGTGVAVGVAVGSGDSTVPRGPTVELSSYKLER